LQKVSIFDRKALSLIRHLGVWSCMAIYRLASQTVRRLFGVQR
jgi:hypothetical protein